MGLAKGSRVSRSADGVQQTGVITDRPNQEGFTYVRWVCSQTGENLKSYMERVNIAEVQLIAENIPCPVLDELRRKILR